MKFTKVRITKKHQIVHVMLHDGSRGDGAVALPRQHILSRVHELFGGRAPYKASSNTSYFLKGNGNGSELSLVNQGLIERTGPNRYRLTAAGKELAQECWDAMAPLPQKYYVKLTPPRDTHTIRAEIEELMNELERSVEVRRHSFTKEGTK